VARARRVEVRERLDPDLDVVVTEGPFRAALAL
jgi:hypothetical protein